MTILLEGDECHEVKIKPCDGKGCAGWIWCNLKVDIFRVSLTDSDFWAKTCVWWGMSHMDLEEERSRQRVQLGQKL